MRTGILILGLAAIALAAAATAGAALGLFFGAFLWATEAVAGPFAPAADEATPWWVLAVLSVVLVAEGVCRWTGRGDRPAREGANRTVRGV